MVSIKPAEMHTSRAATNGLHISPGRFYDGYVAIEGMIRWAYDMQSDTDLTGGLAWTKFAGRRNLYVVTATMDPRLTPAQIRLCLQRVLTERFGLVLHTESKQSDYLALEVALGGAKFLHDSGASGGPPPEGSWPGGVGCRRDSGCQPITMVSLASSLPLYIGGQRVIDRTGLTGKYYIGFWSTETVTHFVSAQAAKASGAPSTYTALKKQLGLRLVPAKGPLKVYYIDHVENPTPN